jgi:hypothetical protein
MSAAVSPHRTCREAQGEQNPDNNDNDDTFHVPALLPLETEELCALLWVIMSHAPLKYAPFQSAKHLYPSSIGSYAHNPLRL